MNIVVLSVYPFPNGFAATNRIISYSKGLVELGNNVINLIVRPTEKGFELTNKYSKGIFEGIEFYYTNGKTKWSSNQFVKIFQLISGFFLSFVYLLRFIKNDKVDIVIVSIDNIFYTLSYSIILRKIFRLKVLFISDEYPKALRNNRFPYNYLPNLFTLVQKFAYKYFDGIIVMTKALKDYFATITKNRIPLQLVLMTVELERFNIKKLENINDKYLAFIGDLTADKDGLDILIKSYSIIEKVFPNYILKIAGTTKNKEDIHKLYKLVHELNITKNVEFIGKLNREDVPRFLCNAELLLLSRPKSERSDGGFPTKLGEYLASGNPVVVTRVGEIPEYLEDGISAFLAEPDSVESFSKKIIEALNNLEKAKKVGANGKIVAENVFNYKVQSKIMNDFLIKILAYKQKYENSNLSLRNY